MQIRKSQHSHYQSGCDNRHLDYIIARCLHAILNLFGSIAQQAHQKQLPRTHKRRCMFERIELIFFVCCFIQYLVFNIYMHFIDLMLYYCVSLYI